MRLRLKRNYRTVILLVAALCVFAFAMGKQPIVTYTFTGARVQAEQNQVPARQLLDAARDPATRALGSM